MTFHTEIVATAAAAIAVLVACGGEPAPAAPASTEVVAGPPVAAPASPSSSAPTQPPPSSAPLARVAWLQGKWKGTVDGADVEESWTAPEAPGTVMKGASKTTKAGKVVASETLAIEVRPDAYVYVAEPSGQKKTEFVMKDKASTGTTALFVNLEHDWPTQIRYERSGDDLKVKIQGRPGQQVVEYTLKLTK